MSCYNCVGKEDCPYIRWFNIDKNVGCVAFQDKDHITHIANTLNEEIDCKYDLGKVEYKFSNKLYLINDIKSIVYEDKEYNIKILKAFDIIKEKKVDVGLFLTIMEDKNQNDKLWSYNFWNKKNPLTEEEFDLLKEVLS